MIGKTQVFLAGRAHRRQRSLPSFMVEIRNGGGGEGKKGAGGRDGEESDEDLFVLI